MSAEVVEYWLQTGRNAAINQLSVKPIEHAFLKGKPLSSQKGQAEAFFLIDDGGSWWILKKFHDARNLDRSYLSRVASVLPREDRFICGTERQILYRGALQRTMGYHYSKNLDKWLDGTILMPKVAGFDWTALADDIRDRSIKLDEPQRVTLCMNLTQLVQLLENCRCSHRDLSCGNVFIDSYTWQVYLIDFDSLYHPSLRMPQATTCGTTGYTPHHAWNNGNLDPRRTWCECADRYALALINVEFLLVSPGAKDTGEGGIFDQDELRNQSGSGINSVISQLRSRYPHAAQLLEAAIRSRTFSECPSPQDWNDLFNGASGFISTPPSLDDLNGILPGHFARILSRCRPAAPLWPAPNLREMPMKIPQLPAPPETQGLTATRRLYRWIRQGG
jgi:hypothetical protein